MYQVLILTFVVLSVSAIEMKVRVTTIENITIVEKVGGGLCNVTIKSTSTFFLLISWFFFSGNFGDVYRGTWQGSNVACKKLKNSDLMHEFEAEAATLT